MVFKKNLVVNDVDKVVTFQPKSDSVDQGFDFLFEDSYQNVEALYKKGLVNNKKIILKVEGSESEKAFLQSQTKVSYISQPANQPCSASSVSNFDPAKFSAGFYLIETGMAPKQPTTPVTKPDTPQKN